VSKIQTSIGKAMEKSRRSKSGDKEDALEDKRSGAGFYKARNRSTQGVVEMAQPGVVHLHKSAPVDRDMMEANLIVSEVDDRSALAAYKICRTRVLQRMRTNNWSSLLVTSTGAGEGKTLTACNLAVSISWDVNQSVLLVDLDLQRSKVARYFGFGEEVRKGIGEYLIGAAEIPDIVYRPAGMDRISVIPSCGTVENSSDFLAGPRMRELLAWTRQQSDQTIVIFDMPPVMVDDDVLAFCPEVDAVLLVVAQGKTDRVALEKATHLLAETNILGVVLNKCDDRIGEYAYGYY